MDCVASLWGINLVTMLFRDSVHARLDMHAAPFASVNSVRLDFSYIPICGECFSCGSTGAIKSDPYVRWDFKGNSLQVHDRIINKVIDDVNCRSTANEVPRDSGH